MNKQIRGMDGGKQFLRNPSEGIHNMGLGKHCYAMKITNKPGI